MPFLPSVRVELTSDQADALARLLGNHVSVPFVLDDGTTGALADLYETLYGMGYEGDEPLDTSLNHQHGDRQMVLDVIVPT